jgi:hypothetical protein
LGDDQPAAGGLDAVVEYPELRADAELLDLVLDEQLRRLGERLLHLTDVQTTRLPGLSRQYSTTAPAMKWDLPEPLPPLAPL